MNRERNCRVPAAIMIHRERMVDEDLVLVRIEIEGEIRTRITAVSRDGSRDVDRIVETAARTVVDYHSADTDLRGVVPGILGRLIYGDPDYPVVSPSVVGSDGRCHVSA